ncbi:MAG: hypothetical protein M5U22_06030 [Thermoleophilia bacterium]|nr:hypothetical protein [Thermoleophilia bacterium]
MIMTDVAIPLEQWNGSEATRELHETIRQLNETPVATGPEGRAR